MLPEFIHAAQADKSSGSLPFLSVGQNWLSPPNFETLVVKLWPAAPGVFRLQATNNELDVTYSAAALAGLQTAATQA